MEKFVFVANRTDGLGERLRALLNAIALSELYEGEFKFIWQEKRGDWHSVFPAGDVFSNEFINAHLLSSEAAPALNSLAEFFKNMSPGYYVCGQSVPASFFSNNEEYLKYRYFLTRSFEKVDFSEKVKKIICESENVPLSAGAYAIHLRAGDIVYGHYKNTISFCQKVIPFPLAVKIIRDLSDKNNQVVAFGQDKQLLRYIGSESNVVVSDNLIPENLDPLESSFFDISLMSRCQKIFSGNSGFAILSSLKGGVEHCSPERKISKNDCEYFFDMLNHCAKNNLIPCEQVAFSCKSILVDNYNILDKKEVLDFVFLGKKCSDNDLIFDFFHAWVEFLHGDSEQAECVLGKMLSNIGCFNNFFHTMTSSNYHWNNFIRVFPISVIEPYKERPYTSIVYERILLNDR